jgi:hypothetical protein
VTLQVAFVTLAFLVTAGVRNTVLGSLAYGS